ncbi:hypothetical protein HNV12_13595 [Methanococcoides sp. SA1]|nr:hypothetical protein [Methanococcoides sp. SA1]
MSCEPSGNCSSSARNALIQLPAVLPELVDLVNADGSQYNYMVSERLGKSSSKEQYAYIYNTQTADVTAIPETDPEIEGTDPFHRHHTLQLSVLPRVTLMLC